MKLLRCVIVLVVALGTSLASSCGRNEMRGTVPDRFAGSSGLQEASLASLLQELSQMQPPPSLEPRRFDELKHKLAEALSAQGESKFVLRPVQGEQSRVSDLGLFIEQDGTAHFDWTYANLGDYNQSGKVDVMDVFPIADYFGSRPADSEFPLLVSWLDGDGSGKVDIGDVFPIAENFFSQVSSYMLEGSNSPTEGFTEVDTVAFALASWPPNGIKQFSIQVSSLDFAYYRVTPLDSEGRRGIPSNVVSSTAEPPTILGVSPKGGLTGEEITFTATVEGTRPFSYLWDFGGGAEPSTSEEESPTVILGAPGSYAASLRVSNIVSEALYEFELVISYAGGPPVIQSITVPTGYVGQSVQFSATISADPPVTSYLWTFSGGLDVDSSTEPAPIVSFVQSGKYDGSLTVYNDVGSDSENFKYIIGEPPPPPPPPQIYSVSPTEGLELTKVQFSAAINSYGTPSYNWNFGNLGYPTASTVSSPWVMLGSSGTYSCSLTVTDEYGSTTLPFSVTVTGSWTKVDIARASAFASLSIVSGRPAVAFVGLEGSGQQTQQYAYYSICSTADGTGTWDTLRISNSAGSGQYISLAVIGGKPAASYQLGGAAGDLYFGISSTANGLGAWTNRLVEDGVNTGLYTTLAEVNGNPGIAYFDYYNTDLKFARNSQPDGSGTWNIVTIDFDAGQDASMAIVLGRPAITYRRLVIPGSWVKFRLSDDADGSTWTSQKTVDFGEGRLSVGFYTSLAVVDGRPAVSYYEAEYGDLRFAINENPDGRGNWLISQVHTSGFVGGNTSLAVINGYPMISYVHYGDGSLFIAINSEPDASGGWVYATVDQRSGVASGDTSLIELNGRPAIAYVGIADSRLRFAVRDY